ncbi:MAG: glycosyltransferase family 4 protein [Anaerolineae bacterium]|nr:glycosyltransferase family 4 protein [Anaerolineae bacterium]
MLIAIDASRATHQYRTGTEGYSLQIIRTLVAQGQQHRFHLYLRDDPPQHLLPAGENIDYRVLRRQRLWTHTALGPAVRRDRPDVLFVPAHVVPWPGVGSVPAVVTIHDLGYLHYPESHPLSNRLYLDWSTRHSVKTAKRVIAISQATADDLIRLNGVPRQKIRVVHFGIGNAGAEENGQSFKEVGRRLGIPGPYILHMGSLHPRKNLARLIDAFALIKDTVNNLSLVMAGQPGWGYDQLLEKIAGLGLAENVILPGYVSDADRAALYAGARVYAFPSLYEGFGFPVLEAMAQGVPVVCSNTSSLPELVGDAALTIDPLDVNGLADALRRLLIDEELRQTLTKRGFQRVRLFSWEACAQATLEVLAEAADAGQSHR